MATLDFTKAGSGVDTTAPDLVTFATSGAASATRRTHLTPAGHKVIVNGAGMAFDVAGRRTSRPPGRGPALYLPPPSKEGINSMSYESTILPLGRRIAAPAAAPRGRPRGLRRVIAALIERWAAAEDHRRNLEAMRTLPDHLLRDVGVTRDDIRLELRRARRW